MSVWRTLIAAAVLMLLLPVVSLVVSGTGGSAGTQTLTDFLTPYSVSVGEVRDTISAVGRLEANRTVGLAFQTNGRVIEVLVRVGDTVQQGDVLARLDTTNQQIVFDQAMLLYEQAQILVQELRNSPTTAELTAAEAALTGAQGAYAAVTQSVSPEDIQAAELRYQQALQQVETLRQARANMTSDLPGQEYQLAEARIGAATMNAEVARLQLENLRNRNRGPAADAGAGVHLAQLQLQRVQMGARPEQIAVAQAAVERAVVRVTEAQIALNNATLTATMSGIVTRVNAQVGQPADLTGVAVEVSDLSQLWLSANVDEVDIDRVYIGLPAQVRVDALPDETFAAVSQQIALLPVVVNAVVNYPTRFRIESDDTRLRAGMTAEVRMVIDERQNVLIVPNEYITYVADRASVTRLLPNGQTQTVSVVVGLRGDTHAEIISGLRDGDQISNLPAVQTLSSSVITDGGGQSDSLLPVETTSVQQGDLSVTISATGKVGSAQQSVLAFETPAVVRDILVSVGQVVNAGDVLARIDTTDLNAARLNAQAALAEAQANYDSIIAPPREIDIQIAEAEVAAAQASLYAAGLTAPTTFDEQIAALQVQLASNALWQAQLTRDLTGGNSGMWVDGSGNASVIAGINNAQSDIAVSQANYDATLNRNANAGSLASASGRLEQAQVALDNLLRGPTAERRRRAEIDLENARLALQQAEERLRQAELRAPYAGVVAQINLAVGQSATRDRTLMLIDANRYFIDLTINESDIASIQTDQSVEVRLDTARERLLTGRVTTIGSTPIPAGTTASGAPTTSQRVTYNVRVQLDPSDMLVRPGMSATGSVVLDTLTNVLFVPTRFIRTDPNTFESLVTIPGSEPGSYEQIVVILGARNRDFTQITAGVQAGQAIVIPPEIPTAEDSGLALGF
ncbi:MAG: efflux RND transporter periplasmic adaptor subunit [Chloroflexota bacterium]|nr:efflux RND transporter periplasmic adaptor subunit [Chloroflexota bacterium]